jgi:hypothetical protein
VDWNQDGKQDLLAGDSKGNVTLFINEGTAQSPQLAAGILVRVDGMPIKGTPPKYEKGVNDLYHRLVPHPTLLIGIYSKIHFGDWNGDGLADLLVGQSGPGGHDLLFYKNTGKAQSPNLARPEPIELPAPPMSRPSPFIVDWDGDGTMDLLFGTERPKIYFFRNEGSNQSPKLVKGKEVPLTGVGFDKGYRCRIDLVDWNEDGRLDILVGNFYSDKKPSGGNIWLFLAK